MGVHSFFPVGNLGERSAGVHSFFPVLVKVGRALVLGYTLSRPLVNWEGKVQGYTLSCLFISREGNVQGYTLVTNAYN